MSDRRLFGEVPEDLAPVGDKDLAALLATHLEAVDRIVGNDEEFLGDLSAEEILAEMEAGVEGIERMKAEMTAREEAAGTFQSSLGELAARVKPVEELATEDTTEAEPETVEEPGQMANQAVHSFVDSGDGSCMECGQNKANDAHDLNGQLTAAVETVETVEEPAKPRRLARPSSQHRVVAEAEPEGFVAASGIPGFQGGQRLDTELDIAKAMLSAHQAVSSLPPGFRQNVPVATLDLAKQYPDDRQLISKAIGDPEGIDNWNLIKSVTKPGGRSPGNVAMVAGGDMQALVAAGGVCAPVTPYYGQQFIATMDRPVRDALVAFNADRGGIRYNPPIGVNSITGSTAIGIVTEAEDAEGGTFAAKTCQTVSCVAAVEVDVDIIYHCITWSNLTARTFPERVAQYTDTVMAAFNRLADTHLLDAIKTGSTAVTQANTNTQGAVSSLLGSVLTAAAGQRSRQRMDPNATLRALFPAWSRELLVADIVRSQFQRFDMSEAGLIALLRSYNIEPSFYLDGPSTGTGQTFGAQTAGALVEFPTAVQWALFPEGTWLFLDGGVLELGIVRDSVLNAENQFQIFGESFENAANVGIESLWVTTTVCPSGTVAAPKDNSSFCS